MKTIQWAALARFILCILLCQAAGFIGALFTTPSIPTWYAGLAKPSFNPPNWIFGPVWTTLFLLMGIALFLVWSKGSAVPFVKTGIILFSVQLVLNILWSVLFFGLKTPLAGLACIVALWLAILFTIIEFFKVSSWAGSLLIPYLLWVSFASVLNFYLWKLNP
jgi:benzodiazapine receptor